ncbi:hypothetical protein HU200_051168 [Digitaria exilis]|uniref:Uncharacterized protein n=1 Tax=Digitaria exilis TaxID=1010633 RepID=A0A835ALX5_9POAL|nr:hypothetical protein HU200_051168 [Digitaria exilis]
MRYIERGGGHGSEHEVELSTIPTYTQTLDRSRGSTTPFIAVPGQSRPTAQSHGFIIYSDRRCPCAELPQRTRNGIHRAIQLLYSQLRICSPTLRSLGISGGPCFHAEIIVEDTPLLERLFQDGSHGPTRQTSLPLFSLPSAFLPPTGEHAAALPPVPPPANRAAQRRRLVGVGTSGRVDANADGAREQQGGPRIILDLGRGVAGGARGEATHHHHPADLSVEIRDRLVVRRMEGLPPLLVPLSPKGPWRCAPNDRQGTRPRMTLPPPPPLRRRW